jgi:drug/metabolite transporter (DMT)-like permease
MTDVLLYGTTVAIWGSTWLAIKYQLGVVAPEVSIAYRFALAAAILLVYCWVARRRLRFSLRDHGGMAVQGLFLFSANYFVFYLATFDLTTGLIAVVFSTMVIFNTAFGALLFGLSVRPAVVGGGLLGLAGLVLIFWPEIRAFDLTRAGTLALGLSVLGTALASLGNMASVNNQRRGRPVIETNAYGMAYGAAFMALFALVRGQSFDFDPSAPYVVSLVFLAVFGSVFAFGCYLTLLGRIGADRAAYAMVLFPVIALGLSTLFEGFGWTPAALLGVALVLAGNAVALGRLGRRRRPIPTEAPTR